MDARSVNNKVYDTLGDRWYTADDDPIALLRAEARFRNPWIIAHLREHLRGHLRVRLADPPCAPYVGLRILDLGCGAGFLANDLAAAQFEVVGLDASRESLQVARAHDATGKVRYVEGDARALPFENGFFDAVCAMDFLEHVDDPGSVIREAARVLKPGGLFFFYTFNRNWLSRVMVVKAVEWFVKNTPPRLHLPELFITPEEMARYCQQAGMSISTLRGVRPKLLSLAALRLALSGRVPPQFSFAFTRSLRVAYLGIATRDTL